MTAREESDNQRSANSTGLLKGTLECLPPTYITLDALDECTDRDRLLSLLKDLTTWPGTNIHILVTSRDESTLRTFSIYVQRQQPKFEAPAWTPILKSIL